MYGGEKVPYSKKQNSENSEKIYVRLDKQS